MLRCRKEMLSEAMVTEPDAGEPYGYTPAGAKTYSTFGIEGTTYEIGYDCVRKLLHGSIRGKVFLDFGCGAGRSTAFLKELGAGYVYGVDHAQNMIDLAVATNLDGAEFLFIADTIPLPDESVDGAVSLTVFVEIRTIDAMRRACNEIARVLRSGGPFIMMSINPMAFGHTFRNFGYPATEQLHSGAITRAILTAPGGQISIDDTYWTEDDYKSALSRAGFTVESIDYPHPGDSSAWATDEAAVPPFIVIKAIK
jgi:ubiquinone/menaquinone biosynthesis C-methylase UbiE